MNLNKTIVDQFTSINTLDASILLTSLINAMQFSAWKISHRSIKWCIDELDHFEKAPYPTDAVWEIVKDHFDIQSQADLLEHFYSRFDKAKISSLCKKIADLAIAKGDPFSKYVFAEAGEQLARSIATVVKKASPELVEKEGGVHVVCVGSVWLSWELLKPGFVAWIKKNTEIRMISLLRLTKTTAVGACYMAADKAGLQLRKDYTDNYTVLYKYDKRNNFIS